MERQDPYRVAKGKQAKVRFGRKSKDDEEDEQNTGASSMASSITGSPTNSTNGAALTEQTAPALPVTNMAHIHKPFKRPGWHASKKTKNLKQIITADKAKEWKANTPTYWNIEALPSMTPQKKYCDITGLEARYTDPKTRLRYHSTEVYQLIKSQPIGVVQQYLGLRNAAVVLK
ncbi:chromatin-remodeling complex subunit ies6 [Mortierella sp. GBA39]|nr:chromatin-remodeling complex subunit ies6 [Mortierella sp. GBA39]